jgi:hypothetical protein
MRANVQPKRNGFLPVSNAPRTAAKSLPDRTPRGFSSAPATVGNKQTHAFQSALFQMPQKRRSAPSDAVGGDFDFGNVTEGEQKLYQVLEWLFRHLFHNVANSVGERSLEHYALGLPASKVHTRELAGLEHDSWTKILQLRDVKCRPFPIGSCSAGAYGGIRTYTSICAKGTRESWV